MRHIREFLPVVGPLLSGCEVANMRRRILTGLLVLTFSSSALAAEYATAIRFPDYGYMLDSKEYEGRRFRLSQDYPTSEPKLDAALKNILAIDFTKDWERYAYAVRDYVLEGNIGTSGDDYENDFFLIDNRVRPWFHPPWLHWGGDGTEGFHGLARDALVVPFLLSDDQPTPARIYSVSSYNELGGYVIGQVWPKADQGPDLSYFARGNLFPEGSILVALAVTTAKDGEVPYLQNPIEWNAYIRCIDIPDCETTDPEFRKETKVRFIQMDVMVRDERAKYTGGWVFTAFLYNGKLGNANKWLNTIPLGLSWGNDPEVRLSTVNANPTETIVNDQLKTTRVSTSKDLPPMHLGWGGRFNGMFNGSVNAAVVSCGSCHTASQYPTKSAFSPRKSTPPIPIPPNGTLASDEWMRLFQDLKQHQTLDAGTIPFDQSFLLLKGIYAYMESLSQLTEGKFEARDQSRIFDKLK